MTFSPTTARARARCERAPRAAAACAALPPAEDDLPLDPRQWSRGAVARWAARAGARPDRFPMNGKALCLMSQDMFSAREPLHGRPLYLDFRRRLARALALQDLLDKMAAH